MQKYDRTTELPPRFLSSDEARRRRLALAELFEDQERRAQTGLSTRAMDLQDPTVRGALETLFRGKCAFCEAATRVDPYRFRPAAEARPGVFDDTSHLYYSWLADAWENIYPICASCRPAEPDDFPTIGRRAPLPTSEQLYAYADSSGHWPSYPPKERAELLEPCVQASFVSHLHLQLDGAIFGLSVQGRRTVAHFNLDRPQRTREREAAFEQYLSELLAVIAPSSKVVRPERVFGFLELPFGGAWYLLLRRIALQLVDDEQSAPPLSQAKIGQFLMRWQGRLGARAQIEAAIAAVREQDEAGPPLEPEPPRKRSTTARVNAVSIKNYKGIEVLEFRMAHEGPPDNEGVQRAPALMILGENATCKSTILEAIAIALSAEDARNALKLKAARLRLDPKIMGSATAAAPPCAEVWLGFNDGGERRLLVDARGVSASGRDDLPPVFAYGAFRQYLEGRRRYAPQKSIISLFRTEAILSNPEEWLLGLESTDFNAVIRTLRHVFAVEGDVDVVRAQPEQNRCVVVSRVKAADDRIVETETPLSMVSSGFRSVLAMVCDVLQGLMDRRVNPRFAGFRKARGIVLIDEIEAHLHPRWKMQIMGGLRAALPEMTFIATTHDPLCLRGIEDEEVLVLHRIAGAETSRTKLPVFVEVMSGLPGVSRLTIEQLLTSDFFSLFSTDSPIAERSLAQMADLLAQRRAGTLKKEDAPQLRAFEAEIARSLPVGSTAVQRLVEDAVAKYLQKRRRRSSANLKKLEEAARNQIIKALEGI